MLLTFVSNIQLISQVTRFQFNSLNKVKFCGNQSNKELLVTLDIGEIKTEDELESIAFEIEYDISYYRFDFVLTSQTLLDQFEYNDYKIINDEGLILIDAGNTTIGKKISGNKLFLALSGRFIGTDCTKDGFIRVNRVLFNDEYKRKNVINDPYFIVADIDTLNAGKYFIEKLQDTITFDSIDVVKDLELKIKYDFIFDYFTTKISKKSINSSYSINDVRLENINYFLAKNITDDSIEIKITKRDNKIEPFNLIFEINKNNLDTNTYKFNFNNLKFEVCNCNLNLEMDLPFISQIKYNKDTIDSNNSSIKQRGIRSIYSLNKSILKVNNKDLDLKYLKIWNLEGKLLNSFDLKENSNLIANLEQNKNEVLILQFIFKDNTYYTDKVIIQD